MATDSGTHPRRLKREDPSQITAKAEEITPQNRRERRHGVAPVAAALHAPYVSRRGLLHDLYFARCTDCGFYRRYQSLGLRICPCGARYELVAA